jgi:hypothetical protein
VLDEPEETMRTTFLGLQELDYPAGRCRIIAVVNENDAVTTLRLHRLSREYRWLEIMVVPPTTDPSWDVVWEAWDREPNAYWWHAVPPRRRAELGADDQDRRQSRAGAGNPLGRSRANVGAGRAVRERAQ